ncbi:MAG TPA: hypothetical protein VG603_09690 [Chitinophagales bacterium]|nr:hypothetical protein [Chitinophagales bacterium]
MARKPALLFLLITLCFSLFAQDGGQKQIDLRDYQYKHEASGGFRIQSNGVTVYGEYGWIKDMFKTRLLQVEYTYYVDYRWKKQKAQIQDGRDFIFGLDNHFHTIRVNYGIKRTIADKADKNGVRLTLVAFGGVALGLLKPYYLDVVHSTDAGYVIQPERYSAANASLFLNKDSIADAAPTRYGLNQMQPVVGLHGKLGLNFDWGTKDEFVKAIEAGVMLDVYYKRLPIMLNDSNRFYQFGVYLAAHFGKRW